MPHCYHCGAQNDAGNFCSQCGTSLKHAPPAKIIARQHHYFALRFISDLITFIGWLFVVAGFILPLALYSIYGGEGIMYSDPYNKTKDTFAVPTLVYIASFLVPVISGLLIIARGESIRLFLDIHDDIHRNP